MGRELPSDAIGIEVDVEDDIGLAHVGPSELEAPVTTLRLAIAYLDLIEAIAADRDLDLQLRGLEVVDKCTAVLSRVNTPDLARQCAADAAYYIALTRPPRGIRSKVEAVLEARGKLPGQYKATAVVGSTRREIDRDIAVGGYPAAHVQLRATPIRVGGKTPSVTFEAPAEERRFTLRVHLEQAKRIAQHLYGELDIEALVLRAADGLIERGELLAFHALDEGDGLKAWKDFVGDGLRDRTQ